MANVLERYFGGDESKIPVINYLGVRPVPVPLLPDAHILRSGLNPMNVLNALLDAAATAACLCPLLIARPLRTLSA